MNDSLSLSRGGARSQLGGAASPGMTVSLGRWQMGTRTYEIAAQPKVCDTPTTIMSMVVITTGEEECLIECREG